MRDSVVVNQSTTGVAGLLSGTVIGSTFIADAGNGVALEISTARFASTDTLVIRNTILRGGSAAAGATCGSPTATASARRAPRPTSTSRTTAPGTVQQPFGGGLHAGPNNQTAVGAAAREPRRRRRRPPAGRLADDRRGLARRRLDERDRLGGRSAHHRRAPRHRRRRGGARAARSPASAVGSITATGRDGLRRRHAERRSRRPIASSTARPRATGRRRRRSPAGAGAGAVSVTFRSPA